MKTASRLLQIALVTMMWFPAMNRVSAQDAETNVIESLRLQLTNELSKVGTRRENQVVIERLRDDLAKAGDISERKRIIVDMKDTDPRVQYAAIKSAKYVGGDDMISGLAALLSDTNGCRALADVVYGPPREMAAEALANLVENPPVPPIGAAKKLYTEEDVERWRNWWQANKGRFSK